MVAATTPKRKTPVKRRATAEPAPKRTTPGQAESGLVDQMRSMAGRVLDMGAASVGATASLKTATAIARALGRGKPMEAAADVLKAAVEQKVAFVPGSGGWVDGSGKHHMRLAYSLVPEDQIDALGTISGSGPAYVFLLIEEFTRAAIARGFGESEARLLAEQTFVGAGALLAATGENPAELRRRVTSPGGTTERAIAVLQDAELGAVFTRATGAALARSRELAEGA